MTFSILCTGNLKEIVPFSTIKYKNLTSDRVKIAFFWHNLIAGSNYISIDTTILKIDQLVAEKALFLHKSVNLAHFIRVKTK